MLRAHAPRTELLAHPAGLPAGDIAKQRISSCCCCCQSCCCTEASRKEAIYSFCSHINTIPRQQQHLIGDVQPCIKGVWAHNRAICAADADTTSAALKVLIATCQGQMQAQMQCSNATKESWQLYCVSTCHPATSGHLGVAAGSFLSRTALWAPHRQTLTRTSCALAR